MYQGQATINMREYLHTYNNTNIVPGRTGFQRGGKLPLSLSGATDDHYILCPPVCVCV